MPRISGLGLYSFSLHNSLLPIVNFSTPVGSGVCTPATYGTMTHNLPAARCAACSIATQYSIFNRGLQRRNFSSFTLKIICVKDIQKHGNLDFTHAYTDSGNYNRAARQKLRHQEMLRVRQKVIKHQPGGLEPMCEQPSRPVRRWQGSVCQGETSSR